MRRRTFLTTVGFAGASAFGLFGCRASSAEEFVADPKALQVYSAQHQNLTKPWADASQPRPGSPFRSGRARTPRWDTRSSPRATPRPRTSS